MGSEYLLKRGSTYYFRRAIPAALRPSFSGAKEIIYSLHTKDRAEAKRLRSLAAANTDALLEQARMGDEPTNSPETRPTTTVHALPRWAKPLPKAADFAQWQNLHDRWVAERKPTPKTAAMHLSSAKRFFTHCSRNLTDLTEEDVEDFVEILLKDGQTQTNTNSILSRLKTLFSFAKSKKIIYSNPARDVKIVVKDSQKRDPFEFSDLEKIFAQDVFTKSNRPRDLGEAVFWIPLLALCEGAREEEIAQLRLSDVVVRTFFWNDEKLCWPFLSMVRDEADGLRIKTDSGVRRVPIHPFLLRLGFLDYVNSLRDRREKWLFPDLKRGPYGSRSVYFGKWFSSFLREECGITSPSKVFYSFRHTFKDLARDSDIPEVIQRQLMGHGKRDVADGYGKGHGDYRLVEAMKKLRISGLVIHGVPSYSSGDHCYSWPPQS